MDNNELREQLYQLNEEIKNTQAVDERGAELLRDLEGDIQALLDRSGENPGQMQPYSTGNFESALSHFEITHPNLTLMISRLLNTLNSAGV